MCARMFTEDLRPGSRDLTLTVADHVLEIRLFLIVSYDSVSIIKIRKKKSALKYMIDICCPTRGA